MSTCWNCKRKYDDRLELDECPKCGAGLIDSEDDDFISFLGEYDSNDF